jgi:penicillin-binding protein-related factor A (putative recombinase)
MPRRPKTPAEKAATSLARSAARANGAAFERDLKSQHDRYRAAGNVVLRLGPPFEVTGAGSRGRGLTVAIKDVGPPDLALLTPAGRLFLVDLKSTTADRWPLKDLKKHQGEAMIAAGKCGATCGVVLRYGPTTWWLPFPAFQGKWTAQQAKEGKTGECSLTALDIATIGRRVVGLDWLAVAVLETP